MKRSTKQQEDKPPPKRPAARPLAPTNKYLHRSAAPQQEKLDKGARPARPYSKQSTSTANKENLPKPIETPKSKSRITSTAKGSGAPASTAPLTRAASKLKAEANTKGTPSQQATTQVRRPALLAGDSLLNSLDDLTVEFETLKRQSLRPSISGSAIRPPPHKMRASMLVSSPKPSGLRPNFGAMNPITAKVPGAEKSQGSKSITDLAEELFDEPAFLELCGKAMTTSLQRTRDGATAESRVQELAGPLPYVSEGYC